MVKKICVFLLLPVLGYSQSLNVSVENRTAGNQYTTFSLNGENVAISNNGFSFTESGRQFGDFLTYGVTSDYSTVGILQNAAQGARAYLLNTEADTLAAYNTISLDYSDPSLGLFPLNSGEVLLRNNISNFTLYNSLGSIRTSASSGSQSEDGESISEVVFDPNGKTVVLYTPKIKQGNEIGSQAQVLGEGNSTESIFYSSDRFIKQVSVSENGQFVVIITSREGADDEVLILDRFGNELNSIASGEDLVGGALTSDNAKLILYSNRRALVYATLSGERVGSTSFRSPLILAQYFSDDQTIVGVTGSKVENADIFKNLQFHTVNLQQREIARKELDDALGINPNVDMQFIRLGGGEYRLLGANKIINLAVSF